MKAHQIHIALIEDDKQQPLGIVTMENILEKLSVTSKMSTIVYNL